MRRRGTRTRTRRGARCTRVLGLESWVLGRFGSSRALLVGHCSIARGASLPRARAAALGRPRYPRAGRWRFCLLSPVSCLNPARPRGTIARSIRSRNSRQSDPSLSATSHSSRSQPVPPASHQAPDVRHGPACCSTPPPGMPRRSMATRTGRPRSTLTRIATGGRKRRRRPDAKCRPRRTRPPALRRGGQASWRCRPRSSPGRTGASRRRRDDSCRGSAGDPQRRSPTSAPSRAVSVASVSAEGIARSRSEYWTMRAGAGSISRVTTSMAAAGGMRLEIEEQQRAQHLRVTHRGRQLQQASRASSDRRGGDRAAAPQPRDRRVRARPTTGRAGARARTTAARARRSAIPDRSTG